MNFQGANVQIYLVISPILLLDSTDYMRDYTDLI
jgi:hypothetical protein